jgi:hypothetical protein
VNDFEDRIRRELTTVATLARPETIRPLRTPATSRGRRASRWLAPIAAMAAVAGIIAGVTLAGQQTARGRASAAGWPSIYVTLAARYLLPFPKSNVVFDDGFVLSATVRDASTGAALTYVQLWPQRPEHPRGPAISVPDGPAAQVAAAADDRTFVIYDPYGIYILHVAASGRAARLVKLSVTMLPIFSSSTIALSPDGTKLAADVQECPPPSHACVVGIEIVDLATGASRTWFGGSMADALNPVWTDYGKAVMFEWNGYRLLSAAAPPGNLLTRSVSLPYPSGQPDLPPSAVLTPNGRSLLVLTTQLATDSRGFDVVLVRITDNNPRTGRVLRVLRAFELTNQTNPYLVAANCGILSVAPAGLHALLECPQFGRQDGNTFTPLPSGPPGLPSAPTIDAAW